MYHNSTKIIALLLIITTVLIAPLHTGAEENIDHTALKQVVTGSVEDNQWMNAKSKEELSIMLAQYFTGDILATLTEECWNMIKEPTDWYTVTSLTDFKIVANDGNGIVVEANLKDINVLNNTICYGKVSYNLVLQKNNWRIYDAKYDW